ncbi:MAG: chromosomal replication initiator protein DnaA [Culicoidibacterales bacterium]
MAQSELAQNIWSQALEYIRANEKISKTSFDNWFSQTKAISLNQDEIIIETYDTFVSDWLKNKFSEIIQEALIHVLGAPIHMRFIAKEKEATISETTVELQPKNSSEKKTMKTIVPLEPPQTLNPPLRIQPEKKVKAQTQQFLQPTLLNENDFDSNLNYNYTFENFVVGGGNRLAYNIALAVSEDPGSRYNPLFIYGGSGLGKTHLMQAIGNRIHNQVNDKRILYVTCEDFVNDFISNLSKNNMTKFRNKYRDIDILLVDDIQFLAKKEAMQEEFFHTFNHLYQNGKQLVLTCDTQPSEISKLTDRLRTRFEWGIMVDITVPDLETRMAILQRRLTADNMIEEFPQNVIEYIASQFASNIRELEGGLSRLVAYSTMFGKNDINLELAIEALKGFSKTQQAVISIYKIQKIVANYFNIQVDDLKSKKRKQPLVKYRHIAVYLSKLLTESSLQKIGKEFGGRDHTTVMHSVQLIENELKTETDTQRMIQEIKELL